MTENAKRACNRTWDQTVITMGSYSEWFKTEIETKRKEAEANGFDPNEEGPVKDELYWLYRWILPRPDGVSYVVMCLQNFIGEPVTMRETESIRWAFYKAIRDDSITFMLDKDSWDEKMKFMEPKTPQHEKNYGTI